jgi:uncharacterized protein (DUF305 family)
VDSHGNELAAYPRGWAVRGAAVGAIIAVGIAAVIILTSSGPSTSAKARAGDIAYIDVALRQHDTFDAMTAAALARSSRPRLRAFAAHLRNRDLLTAQLLVALHRRISGGQAQLADRAPRPDDAARSASDLWGARVFDRAFVDRMIAERVVLLRSSRTQSVNGADPSLRDLSLDLERRYRNDIRQLRALRRSLSPRTPSERRDAPTRARQAPNGTP